jgi:hypothetical protein
MSKLIVEMDMPTVCDECHMMYDGIVCVATGTEVYPNRQARILKNGRVFDPCENRLDDCPIVGVLPDEHGDLIDRDELLKECYPDDEFDSYVIYADDIHKAKAVIAAERKDNGTDQKE